MSLLCDAIEGEVLALLVGSGTRFVVVGGAAVQHHGVLRPRDDLDILVEPSTENAARIAAALGGKFTLPIESYSRLARPQARMRLTAPYAVDVLSSIAAVDFDTAEANSTKEYVEGVFVSVLSKKDLIATKMARGDPRDELDIAALEALPE